MMTKQNPANQSMQLKEAWSFETLHTHMASMYSYGIS